MVDPHEVTSTDYPYLPIRLEIQGESIEALALLDTVYTGSLIAPDTLHRQALGRPDAQATLQVGDGRTISAPVYLGILEITGFPPVNGVAITLLGDEYILGCRILDRYEITLDHGQRVILKPL